MKVKYRVRIMVKFEDGHREFYDSLIGWLAPVWFIEEVVLLAIRDYHRQGNRPYVRRWRLRRY